MAAGLSLTVVGVALAVRAFPGRYADTVARYVYAGGVGALVTPAAASLASRAEMWLLGDAGLASTMSLVGGLGGAVLEDRVAVGDRRSRLLGIRVRFGEPVNERLRHEVFDAATVIDGMAEMAGDGDDGRHHHGPLGRQRAVAARTATLRRSPLARRATAGGVSLPPITVLSVRTYG